MIQEPFATGNSLIHRLDPRARVVAASAFSFTLALSAGLYTLLSGLLISLSLVLLARLDLYKVFQRLTVVMGFLLLLWFILPWSYGGQTLITIGPLAISRPGVALSIQISLKSTAILLALIALIGTMTTAHLGQALNRLRLPDKIVYLILLTYRYIFVIEHEYQRLLRAARIRNFKPGTNLQTYRTYAYLMGMLFVRAAERATRVHQAMVCRGFGGKFHSLEEFKGTRRDWIFTGLMVVIVGSLIVIEWRVKRCFTG
ncbi:MAG: cobalt ECF transporter T component CbiQ [Deltaproteobacteria bacterium]|nr:cobalt ECF transporter T component CbiQ [Candidatus Anaeroferrophillus wilburensis]MBN2888262.1 cobalt ECF transporter T component CbiQ [Deltaproteobacteria bacterium]